MMDAAGVATPVGRGCLEKVGRSAGLSLYSPGQVLFYEGHRPAGAHFLADGSVALKRKGRTLGRVGPGCALGLRCLLQDAAYPASAAAAEACQVAFVDRTTLLDWLGRRDSPLKGLVLPTEGREPAKGG